MLYTRIDRIVIMMVFQKKKLVSKVQQKVKKLKTAILIIIHPLLGPITHYNICYIVFMITCTTKYDTNFLFEDDICKSGRIFHVLRCVQY